VYWRSAPRFASPVRLTLTIIRQGRWLGVCAGAGIPQPVIDLLNRHIVEIVNSSEYRSLVDTSGSLAVSSTAQEFRELIEETANDAAPIFREFGVQLD